MYINDTKITQAKLLNKENLRINEGPRKAKGSQFKNKCHGCRFNQVSTSVIICAFLSPHKRTHNQIEKGNERNNKCCISLKKKNCPKLLIRVFVLLFNCLR